MSGLSAKRTCIATLLTSSAARLFCSNRSMGHTVQVQTAPQRCQALHIPSTCVPSPPHPISTPSGHRAPILMSPDINRPFWPFPRHSSRGLMSGVRLC
eukprot:XP_001690563.1 predicted protein [Chlamydomonas reinhardtii]